MTEIQTTDQDRITIKDIARPFDRLRDLTDEQLAHPQIQRILHKLQDGSEFRPGVAQSQIEAAYYENEDWVERILEIKGTIDWEQGVLRECRAADLDELGEAWRSSKGTPQADLIAMVIREKAESKQSLPVQINDPYPCKLSAPQNKMHGVLEGNSYDLDKSKDEVLNTPCIEARIGGFNAAGVNVPSEPQSQQE